MKRKQPMPCYCGRNIARHAQKRFLQRKALEANREKHRGCPAAESIESGKEQ